VVEVLVVTAADVVVVAVVVIGAVVVVVVVVDVVVEVVVELLQDARINDVKRRTVSKAQITPFFM
jgi:hypothetical protein